MWDRNCVVKTTWRVVLFLRKFYRRADNGELIYEKKQKDFSFNLSQFASSPHTSGPRIEMNFSHVWCSNCSVLSKLKYWALLLVCRYPPCQWDRHPSDLPDWHKWQRASCVPAWGGNVWEAGAQCSQPHSQRPRPEPQCWTLRLRAGQSSLGCTSQLDSPSPQRSVLDNVSVFHCTFIQLITVCGRNSSKISSHANRSVSVVGHEIMTASLSSKLEKFICSFSVLMVQLPLYIW